MERYKVGDTFKYNGNDVTVTEVYDNGYLVTYEHEGSKYITRVLIGQGQETSKEHEVIKRADGNDLPEIDREVIAILSNGTVVYAHRPKEHWVGENISTGKVTHYYPKRYDKGGWNMPDVKYWLDIDIQYVLRDLFLLWRQ